MEDVVVDLLLVLTWSINAINVTLLEKPGSSYSVAKCEKDPWKSRILGKSASQPPISFFLNVAHLQAYFTYFASAN